MMVTATASYTNFNPRTPCGVRRYSIIPHQWRIYFNPRAPCGARPAVSRLSMVSTVFQSTHPVRGATGTQFRLGVPGIYFNPRAPRGARLFCYTETLCHCHISIHEPRVGRDWENQFGQNKMQLFQSTRPVWGATLISFGSIRDISFQSTRPVWGATWESSVHVPTHSRFQSTRPVWGATTGCSGTRIRFNLFQSTRPVWGATIPVIRLSVPANVISIHAPRVGRDPNVFQN